MCILAMLEQNVYNSGREEEGESTRRCVGVCSALGVYSMLHAFRRYYCGGINWRCWSIVWRCWCVVGGDSIHPLLLGLSGT